MERKRLEKIEVFQSDKQMEARALLNRLKQLSAQPLSTWVSARRTRLLPGWKRRMMSARFQLRRASRGSQGGTTSVQIRASQTSFGASDCHSDLREGNALTIATGTRLGRYLIRSQIVAEHGRFIRPEKRNWSARSRSRFCRLTSTIHSNPPLS